MTITKKIILWINSKLFTRTSNVDFKNKWHNLPPEKFTSVTVLEHPLKNSDVHENTLYLVAPGRNHKWVLFKCPCGCGHVVTLSLQKIHNPYWSLTSELNGSPTIYPSVWQDTPCYSHFWVRKGRVYWCLDSGTPSWQTNDQLMERATSHCAALPLHH